MENKLIILLTSAASIGFFHTLLGPDHYLPFIVMSKARKWSMTKTLSITIACGLGHVLSSIVLGFAGILLGIALKKLEMIESFRGDLAAWAFITFGFLYFIWGIKAAYKNNHHHHFSDGHTHDHSHTGNDEKKNITPWILFTIFVLGPCEPLIPLLMFPAAEGHTMWIVMVSLVFGTITVLTMTTIVALALSGFRIVKTDFIERYMHAIAGAIICCSGLAIVFLGL